MITESRNQSKINKKNLQVLMNTKGKLEMSTLEMDYDWENKQRLNIFQKTKYPVVLNSVRSPEYDVDLTLPPSHKDYKENPKYKITSFSSNSFEINFHIAGWFWNFIGKVNNLERLLY